MAAKPLHWLYGLVFFSQFKPSEPFLVDFLVDVKGFTNRSVYQDMFPIFTYASYSLARIARIETKRSLCSTLFHFVPLCSTLFHFVPLSSLQPRISAAFAHRHLVRAANRTSGALLRGCVWLRHSALHMDRRLPAAAAGASHCGRQLRLAFRSERRDLSDSESSRCEHECAGTGPHDESSAAIVQRWLCHLRGAAS